MRLKREWLGVTEAVLPRKNMCLVQWWDNRRDEGWLDICFGWNTSILLIIWLRGLWRILLIKHLLVNRTDELVLFIKILSNFRNLLSKLVSHHRYYLFIIVTMLSSLGLGLVYFLRERGLIIDEPHSTAHRSCLLLLLLAIDLHDVINNVEIVVYCVPSSHDVLLNLIRRLSGVSITSSRGKGSLWRANNSWPWSSIAFYVIVCEGNWPATVELVVSILILLFQIVIAGVSIRCLFFEVDLHLIFVWRYCLWLLWVRSLYCGRLTWCDLRVLKPWVVEDLASCWSTIRIYRKYLFKQVNGISTQSAWHFRRQFVICSHDLSIKFLISCTSIWEATTEKGK